jgi:hypothetical protein
MPALQSGILGKRGVLKHNVREQSKVKGVILNLRGAEQILLAGNMKPHLDLPVSLSYA